MAPKVLVVLTNSDTNPMNGSKTGWYLPEFAHPYEALASKTEITVASIKGGLAPIDPSSIEMFQSDPVSTKFLESNKDLWEKTKPLKDFLGRASEFDAILYPGGHGPLFDLATDETSIKLIEEFWAAGKVVSAICHGPVVFSHAKTQDGQPLVKGRRVTCFTDKEEEIVGLTKFVPLLVEKHLRESGAIFEAAPEPWGAKAVVDGNLITGQNPASGHEFGQAVAKALGV